MILMMPKRTLYIISAIIITLIILGGFFMFNQSNSQPTLSWHLADKTIIIDPGHGGTFPGKVSKDGVLEKDVNLAIAQHLSNLLQESGCKVIMTRTSDSDLIPASENESKLILKQRADLKQRTIMASENKGDLFISIHCNSIPSDKWCGAQTFFAPDNATSQLLAQNIQSTLIKQLKNTEREAIARPDTFLFKNLTIPAVIVECGFLSNAEETALLTDSAYQQKIAYAVFCGISNYLAEDNN